MAQRRVKGASAESVKIVGLLHDICKCDMCYLKGKTIRTHKYKGHGSRSVKLLEKFGVPLNEFEYRAIRYHMGTPWSKKRRENPEFVKAVSEPLRMAVSIADATDSAKFVMRRKLQKTFG